MKKGLGIKDPENAGKFYSAKVAVTGAFDGRNKLPAYEVNSEYPIECVIGLIISIVN